MSAAEAPFLRFMKGYDVDQRTGCWVWRVGFMTTGYGRIKVFGRWRGAHQFAYELYRGAIPAGMHVLHACDNKKCVNPDHVRLGTHADNMREAHDRITFNRKVIERYSLKRPGQAKPVEVYGKWYESQKSAERDLDLGSGTVRFWINKHDGRARYTNTASDGLSAELVGA